MYYYSYTLIVYKVIQQLIYNLALFLSYLSTSIYLFPLLCGSHLVLIRCKILLVTNIRTKLSLILCSSSIIMQTLHLLLIIERGDLSFLLLYKNFLTLYKLSTLSHLIMLSRVTLCLSNIQVSIYCLIVIQSIYYLSWLFTYIFIFTILLYTPLNSY